MVSVLKPVNNHKYITHAITPLPVPVETLLMDYKLYSH